MSWVVERLTKAGQVNRQEASEDRRGAYAVLTEAGVERIHPAAQAHIAFVLKNFLRHFNEEELEQMGEWWKRLKEK
jgi:DNA-binding MarR family transcriptional regulator